MAQFKYREYLHQITDGSAFDIRHAPGTKVNNPGIYRCAACSEEIAIAKGQLLPPQNDHEHEKGLGKIEWVLLVFAQRSK